MQNPVGTVFNPETMRMEMTSFSELLFNPVAQVKFVHTVSAGYVTGAVFVLAISAWYLLKGPRSELRSPLLRHRRRFWSGLDLVGHYPRRRKWLRAGRRAESQAGGDRGDVGNRTDTRCLHRVRFSERRNHDHRARVSDSYLLGLIATRSVDTPVLGLKELMAQNETRIRRGMDTYAARNGGEPAS